MQMTPLESTRTTRVILALLGLLVPTGVSGASAQQLVDSPSKPVLSHAVGAPRPNPVLEGGPGLQGCAFCTDCGYNGVIGNIAFEPYAPLSINEIGLGVHPNRCFLTGPCAVQHPPTCGLGQADQEDLAEALEAALAAITDGNVMDAYRIARNQPRTSRLYYSPERVAIQIRGCDKQVAVHIPLHPLLTR